MKNIVQLIVLLLLLFTSSCEKWIDVKPSDRVSEQILFESREGFLKALNGIYTGLADPSIYGRTTIGPIEIMAQYFKGNGNVNLAYSQYMYTSNDAVKSTFANYWSKNYYLIVNCNIIIDKCDEKKQRLPGIWYGLIKGEALALRAFLHLDLLRLYGPVYSLDKDNACIPYVTNTNQEVMPLLKAEKVMENIIVDLTEALKLLKDSDPIFENGASNSSSLDGDNSLRYRQYRMNYYAVKGLLARACLWSGNKTYAYQHASEIIREAQMAGSEIFPFIPVAEATDVTNPNRVFSTEIMFAAYSQTIGTEIFNTLFLPLLSTNDFLTFPFQNNNTLYTGRISELYTDNSDIRYRTWWGVYTTTNGLNYNYFRKYEAVTSNAISARFRTMIPLIRMSEMYLIAAECATSLSEAEKLVNTLREKRSCSTRLSFTTETERMTNIEAEFRREFLGEGQMFYFYKRQATTSLPDAQQYASGRTITMNLQQYVVPLPDNEINYRTTNE